jgi:hypothetical protein
VLIGKEKRDIVNTTKTESVIILEIFLGRLVKLFIIALLRFM